MKELIRSLAGYNAWANAQLLAAAAGLPEVDQQAVVASSFPGLHKTFLHMLDAESIWWQRIKLQEKIVVPSQGFAGDLQTVSAQLQQQNKLWEEWIESANEQALQHEFIYFNSKKERFKQPIYQVLLQVFNHGTYHRGQIVTMMRQLGLEKIPMTDYILWCRKK